MALHVRAMRADDWPAVERIYAAGIATGDATFETEPPSWAAFDRGKLPHHRLVALLDDEVVGWAAASAASERCVYAGVAEHSVYVDPARAGQGIGTALVRGLIESTEAAGIWTIQTGIFPENAASLALHERCGFRVVGRRERIGQHHGRWRDVVFLERRSAAIG